MTEIRGRASPSKESSGRAPVALRLDLLKKRLGEQGFVSVAATADELGVSEMTIRRDLARLEEQQLAVRTHGGALAPGKSGVALDIEEPAFTARARKNANAKRIIADAAAKLPQAGQTVGLDVGTTVLELARALVNRGDLKIFTNNVRGAMALSTSGSQVYLYGGLIRAGEYSLHGSIGIAQIRQFWLDHVFIGVSGLTEDGYFDYSLEDTEVKRAYVDQAAKVVVLCDSSKFERMSLVKVCGLESVDILVTDSRPPSRLHDALVRSKTTVIVAGTP